MKISELEQRLKGIREADGDLETNAYDLELRNMIVGYTDNDLNKPALRELQVTIYTSE